MGKQKPLTREQIIMELRETKVIIGQGNTIAAAAHQGVFSLASFAKNAAVF